MRVYQFALIWVCIGFIGCGLTFDKSVPDVPLIVSKALSFHGEEMFQRSSISMTITSLSGSFEIYSTRDGGNFEYTITDSRSNRRVTLSNTLVQEWHDGKQLTLDEEGERQARAFVDARVFFPLLPFTLRGDDVHFKDLGVENWHGKNLHKIKVFFTPETSTDADDNYMFWFDPDTGRIEQFGYDFNGGLRYRKAIGFIRAGNILFSNQENYGIDGGRVPVEMLSPSYVDEKMRLISSVELRNISVTPLR